VEEVDNPVSSRLFPTIPGNLLGVFAKEPLPGEVKTRLCPPFSPAAAAAFHRLALAETLRRLAGGGFGIVLFHTGDGAFFRRRFPSFPLLPQGEGNLGTRMERALARLLAAGAPAAALIGADTPDLPLALIDAAFAALRRADAVVAPARDGGYVLVGVRRPAPELFRGVPWSTAGVLPATRRRAAEAGIPLVEINGWEDVDDPASLERLLARSPDSRSARFARRVLRRRGGW
jgi:rSAM/selenodomain-associated transferase 1